MQDFRTNDFFGLNHAFFAVLMTVFFLLIAYFILIFVKKRMLKEVIKKTITIEERKNIPGFGQIILLSVHECRFLMVSSKGSVAISAFPSEEKLEEKLNKFENENA